MKRVNLKYLNGFVFILLLNTLLLIFYQWKHFPLSLKEKLALTILPLTYWTIFLLIYTLYHPKNTDLVFITGFFVFLTTIGYWLFIFSRKLDNHFIEIILDSLLHILPVFYFSYYLSIGYLRIVKISWTPILIILLLQFILHFWYRERFSRNLYNINDNLKYFYLLISLVFSILIISFIKYRNIKTT